MQETADPTALSCNLSPVGSPLDALYALLSVAMRLEALPRPTALVRSLAGVGTPLASGRSPLPTVRGDPYGKALQNKGEIRLAMPT